MKIHRNILLNPGPATTSQKIKEALVVSDICPRETEFGNLTQWVREKLLEVVKAPKQEYKTILIPGSGTYTIESGLVSLFPHKDEKKSKMLILINGAYGERMSEICKTYHLDTLEIRGDYTNPIDLVLVKDTLKKYQEEIFAVSFVHHETTTGVLNPLKELLEIIHSYHMLSFVDCMSSFAGIEIDFTKTPMDLCISSSNKCIQGIAGVGIVLANTKALSWMKNNPRRIYSLDLLSHLKALEKDNQFLFTPCVQVMYALKAAIEEFFEENELKINRYHRYEQLYQNMYKGLGQLGFESIVESTFHSKILTTFKLERMGKRIDFQKMHDFFYERSITIYPGKIANLGMETFRIANIGDLTLDDISYFLKTMEAFISLN